MGEMQRFVPKQADGLLYSSAPKPVPGVIVFFQTAYDYPATGAGMNKLAVFQVDAYMSHFFARGATGEKYKVALAQIAS